VDDDQSKDGKEEENDNEELDNSTDKINATKDSAVIESNSSTYKYTEDDVEEFFASDNGQEEEHTLEESICRPLIGIRDYKPFFKYCKICPKVENINLKSIEDHIRLKDPEKHKVKLLEVLEKEKENND
jgi:hypothetical protein